EIDAVGQLRPRLHRGDVGVDQHNLHALVLERLEGLRARVVELAGLADLESTRAEQEHLRWSGRALGIKSRRCEARGNRHAGETSLYRVGWVACNPYGLSHEVR